MRQRISVGHRCQENYWVCPDSAESCLVSIPSFVNKKMTLRIPERQEIFDHSSIYLHFREDPLTWYYLLHISFTSYSTFVTTYNTYFKNKKFWFSPYYVYLLNLALFSEERDNSNSHSSINDEPRAELPTDLCPSRLPTKTLHALPICPICHTWLKTIKSFNGKQGYDITIKDINLCISS